MVQGVSLTHRNAQQADHKLHRPKDVEDGRRPRPILLQPVVRLVRQTVAEEVLEDDETRETLDGQVACEARVNTENKNK